MSKSEKLVLIDMDGVLANFDQHLIDIIDSERPELHPNGKHPLREHFYNADDYPENKDYVRSVHNRPGFFRHFPLIDGALEGWQKIIDFGYEPQICSAPLKDNPTCVEDKLYWLEKNFVPHFGRSVVENAIVGGHKAKYDAIALIDDKPKVTDSEKASWTHIIFNQYYNRNVKSDFRLESWKSERLENLLQKAKHQYIKLGRVAIIN